MYKSVMYRAGLIDEILKKYTIRKVLELISAHLAQVDDKRDRRLGEDIQEALKRRYGKE